jgi:hypothetical protein
MIQDSAQQRILQAQIQQSPLQRGRVNEERFVSEVAGGQSVKPNQNQWQQFAGGPLDAQFVSSVDDGSASLMKPGMFVKKLGDVTGNNVDRLGEFRRQNQQEVRNQQGQTPVQVQGQTALEDVVAAGEAYQLRDVSSSEVKQTSDDVAADQRHESVILAALAPLS